jgi:ABC-type glycerol-3-phosphate transport system substrate-binding protein
VGRPTSPPEGAPRRRGAGGRRRPARAALLRAAAGLLLAAGLLACGGTQQSGRTVLTFPGSAVGAEAETLRRQIERFEAAYPDIEVVQRRTPDAADQRHQLYVQWLNAGAGTPDVLQLDVIWTSEFAAAGWILPLDRFHPDGAAFFPAAVAADRFRGRLYALPWFIDVGMLYYRIDLVDHPPATFDELDRLARLARRDGGPPYGFVWQGARYEGLVTVFLEVLGGFGGSIMDAQGHVTVDTPAAVRALTWMRDAIRDRGTTPPAVLTWQEEQTRFAFQNGQAVFMRNWPYAFPLLEDAKASRVAGRFAVAPMPMAAGAPGGAPTAALGGSQLAINARSAHPRQAYLLIDYLTRPEQMRERARLAGQYPTRPALYDEPQLAQALPIPPAAARRIIEHAVPRPVTPVYTQLSGQLQVGLHRALTGQAEPAAALRAAADDMRRLLRRVGLAAGEGEGARER